MRNFRLLSIVLILSFIASCAESKELFLQEGKIYLLNFEDKIENIHANEDVVDAQIVHTIFGDNEQIILSLKNSNEGILQVKTSNNMYNYEIKNSSKSSKELIEIDYPSIENLDVDIYTGG